MGKIIYIKDSRIWTIMLIETIVDAMGLTRYRCGAHSRFDSVDANVEWRIAYIAYITEDSNTVVVVPI